MSTKLIALASSPNKGGNSDTLLDAFLDGVREQSPQTKIEKIYLYDIPCTSYCFDVKEPPAEEAEFTKIAESLKTASGLVIATCTFNFNVPAVLKNFIDRIGYVALDYGQKNIFGQPPGKLGNLRTFFIVTGGTPSWIRRCIFFLYPAFWLTAVMKYYYARLGGSLYGGELTFSNHVKNQPKLLAKAKKRGRKYAKKYLRS